MHTHAFYADSTGSYDMSCRMSTQIVIYKLLTQPLVPQHKLTVTTLLVLDP